uniref:Uncharacterized protein n=1 Tax=Hyaloperonospora arabidopsidis (strain Emoy2) TaxID=559515 RepID=M4B3Q9_HYAAE
MTVLDVVSVLLLTSRRKPEIATYCAFLQRRRRGCLFREGWIACPTRTSPALDVTYHTARQGPARPPSVASEVPNYSPSADSRATRTR